MIKYRIALKRNLLALAALFCVFAQKTSAQITMSTANCTISSNEVQMDILVKNTGTIDLRWNSTVLRMNIPAAILPAGTQTYSFNYLGGSDFPLSFPAPGNVAFGGSYNLATKVLTWTTGNTSAYNNLSCTAPLVSPGQTKTIGRFSFKITSSNFIADAAANFAWNTTSGCNFYQNCTPTVTGYNQFGGPRTLINPCTLTVPGPCNGISASAATTAVSSCIIANGLANISLAGVGPAEQGTYTIDGGAPQAFTGNPFAIAGLSSGNYSVIISGSFSTQSCPSIQVLFSIASVGIISATTSVANVSTCSGNNGSITVNGSGGIEPYTYSLDGSNYQAGNIFNTLGAGLYTVYIKSAGGCIGTKSVTITGPLFGVQNSGSVLNSGGCNTNSGSIVLQTVGGCPPYTFSIDGINYQAGNTFNNLPAGPYTGYAKDITGSIATRNMTIVQGVVDASFNIVNTSGGFSTTSTCNSSVPGVTVQGIGGVAPYMYSFDGSNYQATDSFPNVLVGTHTILVKDVNGCIGTRIFTIDQANLGISFLNATSSNACVNTGSVSVYVYGGASPYSFSLDGINYQAVNPDRYWLGFANIAPGNYIVHVKDATGCENTKPLHIGTVNPNVIGATSIHASSSCINNGSISVWANTGYISFGPYTFSLNAVTFQSAGTFTGLAAGTYTGYVKDRYGCIGSTIITVPQVPGVSLTARFTNSSTCINDGTIQANDPVGGVGPFTYSLDGTAFQAGKSFAGLAAGTYTVTAKDVYGCTATTSVTIGLNQVNVTSYAWSASSCTATSGKIQLFVSGGINPYTYSIDGVTYQSSPLFTSLPAGTYTGFIKDSKGCVGTKAGIVVGPAGCAPTFANNHTYNFKQDQSTDKKLALNVQAFPNPSENEFTLMLEGYNSKEKVLITVTDLLGRNVYQTEGSGKQQYRFGNNFKAGIYVVQVLQGSEKRNIKLVKE